MRSALLSPATEFFIKRAVEDGILDSTHERVKEKQGGTTIAQQKEISTLTEVDKNGRTERQKDSSIL